MIALLLSAALSYAAAPCQPAGNPANVRRLQTLMTEHQPDSIKALRKAQGAGEIVKTYDECVRRESAALADSLNRPLPRLPNQAWTGVFDEGPAPGKNTIARPQPKQRGDFEKHIERLAIKLVQSCSDYVGCASAQDAAKLESVVQEWRLELRNAAYRYNELCLLEKTPAL